MDAIIIEGLKVETVIGCFDWERQIIQPLMLDLVIQTDLELASPARVDFAGGFCAIGRRDRPD